MLFFFHASTTTFSSHPAFQKSVANNAFLVHCFDFIIDFVCLLNSVHLDVLQDVHLDVLQEKL